MAMQNLAPELIIRIFECLSSVGDIINLSLTCRYFHLLLPKAQKLCLFFEALDKEMGPVEDIIQLLTQNNTQTLQLTRSPTLSLALLVQVFSVAKVAQRFVFLYPGLRWTGSRSARRRFLDNHESRKLRSAVYKIWNYSQAFYSHTSLRSLRSDTIIAAERLQLLRSWSSEDLYDLEDLRCTIEQFLATEICPTDGEVSSRFLDEGLLQQSFSNAQPPFSNGNSALDEAFHCYRNGSTPSAMKLSIPELRYTVMRGWGSDVHSHYLLQSFLKLTPGQILWLYDHAISKSDVIMFAEVETADPCFFESGSMLFHDWVLVLQGRGIDVQILRQEILDGVLGIAVD